MKAIEFTTKAKNGVIEIPKEYLTTLNDEFRVIILVEPQIVVSKKKRKLSSLNLEPKKKVARKREFRAFKVKTKGFKFNRDDIYNE